MKASADMQILHSGVNATYGWTHQSYWIPRSRPLIKQVVPPVPSTAGNY